MDLQYLLFLQSLRECSPRILTKIIFFTSEITMSVIPIFISIFLYWCCSKKSGLFFYMSFSIATCLNSIVKQTACVYRPWIKNNRIIIAQEAIKSATGYSFPSGHATTSAAFYSAFYMKLKNISSWFIIPCAFFILLTAFSRNWVCAHTPQDVFCGILLGILSTLICKFIMDHVETNPKSFSKVFFFMIFTSIIFLVYLAVKSYPMDYNSQNELFVDPYKMKTDGFKSFGSFFGIMAGWIVERKFICFSTQIPNKKKLLRLLAGGIIMLLYLVFYEKVMRMIPDDHTRKFLFMFFLSFLCIGGIPFLFKLKFFN